LNWRIIATKKLEKKPHGYKFTEDVEFESPSQAASIIDLSGNKSKV
jgi:hypothetical protein